MCERIKQIISDSEKRYVNDGIIKVKEDYAAKYLDKEEYIRKLAFWAAWPGFSSGELYGKTLSEDRDVKLGSIKIMSWNDQHRYENRLFIGNNVL